MSTCLCVHLSPDMLARMSYLCVHIPVHVCLHVHMCVLVCTAVLLPTLGPSALSSCTAQTAWYPKSVLQAPHSLHLDHIVQVPQCSCLCFPTVKGFFLSG